ncbi:MAG: ATP synthase F1 subunit epsilon [Bacteriovoracaceae bacterium]|jgi:F-type H+-transporting ATPase subunit epsilon|nr:ATP synthase F1 subunit epsilon [Bacteriovoracaceae bacterium]
MGNFTVDILTPAKVIAKDLPAESLLVPTVKGQINVLVDHTHIVSKLETGMVSVFGGANDADKFFSVSTGVCKVLENKIIILTNTSEEKIDIELGRAKKALEYSENMLSGSESLSEDDFIKYTRKIERAKLRIQMASFKG